MAEVLLLRTEAAWEHKEKFQQIVPNWQPKVLDQGICQEVRVLWADVLGSVIPVRTKYMLFICESKIKTNIKLEHNNNVNVNGMWRVLTAWEEGGKFLIIYKL